MGEGAATAPGLEPGMCCFTKKGVKGEIKVYSYFELASCSPT